jgi:carbon-monoxide dehydrogenase medium subunit
MLRLPPFVVHRAATVEQACWLLADLGNDAAVYAGGTELLIALKLGLARYDHLVDTKSISELRGITCTPQCVRIGATVTHRELSQARRLPGALGVLPSIAQRIGNPRVRTAGTVGGSLCFGEPRSDLAIFTTALDGECDLVSTTGRRSISVERLVETPYAADLQPDELLTGVRVGAFAADWRFTYRKIQWEERPLMGLAVGLRMATSGEIAESRLSLGGSDVAPHRFRTAEPLLAGAVDEMREHAASAAQTLNETAEWSDGDGYSAEYKAHLLTVLMRRTALELANSTDSQDAKERT